MLDCIPKACSLNTSALFVYRHRAFAYSPSCVLLYSVFRCHIVFDIHIGTVGPIYHYLYTSGYRNISAACLKAVGWALGRSRQTPQERRFENCGIFRLCRVVLIGTDGYAVSANALPIERGSQQSSICCR
jgi:hypothetical protein